MVEKESIKLSVVEVYTLRKDEEDRWKILGWMLYEESEE